MGLRVRAGATRVGGGVVVEDQARGGAAEGKEAGGGHGDGDLVRVRVRVGVGGLG